MEISKATYRYNLFTRLFMLAFLLVSHTVKLQAQTPVKSYTVKNGRMFIALSKSITEASLDSFITQYDLYDLGLKDFVRGRMLDSLKKAGWALDMNSTDVFIISKSLVSFDGLNNPADKINFTQNHSSFAMMFPPVSSRVIMGYNRFRNKEDFIIKDSLVRFYLRGNTGAKKVMLAGSFNDWSPETLAMQKADDGWVATVPLSAGKYWYKFIVDGNWTTDKDNILWENDGLGNNNSVYYKTNMVFRLNGFQQAKKVYLSGSFNNWEPRDLLMKKTNSGWELPMYLANGTHTYRFVVDGKWMPDPGNQDKFPNEFHDFNSVYYIGKPYLFQLDGYSNARQVALAGSFNNWRKDELFMKKTDKGWELPYTLGSGNYSYQFIVDGKYISKPDNKTGSGNLNFIIGANQNFVLKGFADAKQIYIAGDFNDWAPNNFPLKKTNDGWTIALHLSPGKHLYKFIVDGKWIVDPGNTQWEQNEFGTGNSVIWKER